MRHNGPVRDAEDKLLADLFPSGAAHLHQEFTTAQRCSYPNGIDAETYSRRLKKREKRNAEGANSARVHLQKRTVSANFTLGGQ